jgi:NADH-quinone oxidoreductase subunit C
MIPEGLRSNPNIALLGDRVIAASADRGELTLEIAPARIVETCRMLKASGFNRLSAVTAVDWHPQEPRFEVVYHLHRLPLKGGPHERLRLKCRVGGETPEIETVSGVWAGANWYEREVFDLFGISFAGHPDLRRIMMPEDWIGHPLRKDYPIHGHKYDYAGEN